MKLSHGHASRIGVGLDKDGYVVISDNGRGIPVDPHPKYKDKSALEVILTTLHSGGKFSGKAYATSGGLHGVGISVVNALCLDMEVEVARDKQLWSQKFAQGKATTKLIDKGAIQNRRGTTVRFTFDPEIFGEKAKFNPMTIFKMARSKAYLHRGVEIRWQCHASHLPEGSDVPTEATIHFPGGLADYLSTRMEGVEQLTDGIFSGQVEFPEGEGRMEWAVAWPAMGETFVSSYCNTIPTPMGGTHESGLRIGLSRSIKSYAELLGNKKSSIVTPDDVMSSCSVVLSIFIREPQFQGQTKEKLTSGNVNRLVESAAQGSLRPMALVQSSGWQAADRFYRFAGGRTPQETPRKGNDSQVGNPEITPAGQACRLLKKHLHRHRTLHGRGRFSWWFSQTSTFQRNTSHSATAWQDPERCISDSRQIARQPRAHRFGASAWLRFGQELRC